MHRSLRSSARVRASASPPPPRATPPAFASIDRPGPRCRGSLGSPPTPVKPTRPRISAKTHARMPSVAHTTCYRCHPLNARHILRVFSPSVCPRASAEAPAVASVRRGHASSAWPLFFTRPFFRTLFASAANSTPFHLNSPHSPWLTRFHPFLTPWLSCRSPDSSLCLPLSAAILAERVAVLPQFCCSATILPRLCRYSASVLPQAMRHVAFRAKKIARQKLSSFSSGDGTKRTESTTQRATKSRGRRRGRRKGHADVGSIATGGTSVAKWSGEHTWRRPTRTRA